MQPAAARMPTKEQSLLGKQGQPQGLAALLACVMENLAQQVAMAVSTPDSSTAEEHSIPAPGDGCNQCHKRKGSRSRCDAADCTAFPHPQCILIHAAVTTLGALCISNDNSKFQEAFQLKRKM